MIADIAPIVTNEILIKKMGKIEYSVARIENKIVPVVTAIANPDPAIGTKIRETVAKGIFDQIPSNRRLSGNTPPTNIQIPKMCDALNNA